MLNKNIKISSLQVLLDHRYGKEWLEWEPETIMSDLGFPDYLVLEKIYVLKVLNENLNRAIAVPEFLIWATSICNNEYADFEMIAMPNCLELAWAIDEIKKIGLATKQSFQASEELIGTTLYLLQQEGFSSPIPPFEFIPESMLTPGQHEEDTDLKIRGINAYLSFMSKIPAFTENT